MIIEFLIFQINEALSKVIRVQLYLIAHQIYNPLDNGFEVRGIFLDIPKVIHKAWHGDVLFKLRETGNSEEYKV